MAEKLKKILAASALLLPFLTFGQNPLPLQIEVTPERALEGDALMITLPGTTVAQTARIYFDDKSLWFFTYNSMPTALYGIDLNARPGNHTITVKMEDGRIFTKNVYIEERKKYEAPLGIPESLGGNTPEAATNLITNLTRENDLINNLYSAPRKYWVKFVYPLASSTITDPYGYLRKTGYYDIAHKGTDFQAKEGTPVMSIGRGIVRLARKFTVYGNAVAIDHGLGLVSYYMHLSKISVKEGQIINSGDVIGLSGMSGYAEGPHLHLSIKLYGVSVDPEAFLKLGI